MVFGGKVFGWRPDHEGRTLTNGISGLLMKTLQNSLALLPGEDTGKRQNQEADPHQTHEG